MGKNLLLKILSPRFDFSHGKFYRLRAIGSAAINMAYVASGGADCYFEFGIHAWDIGKTKCMLVPLLFN